MNGNRICTSEEGRALVKAARNSVELSIRSPKFKRDAVKKSVAHLKQFSSFQLRLLHQPTGTIRGNYVSTELKPLAHSVVDAAVEASAGQHKPISMEELDDTIVELHLITSPKKVTGSAEARKKSLTLGKDGIMLKYGDRMSIMMPYYASENGWEKESFLGEACVRAGLPKNHWMQPNVSLYKFETQVFAEKEPNGSIVERT